MRVSRSGFLSSLAALGALSGAAPAAAALPPWYPLPPPLKPKIPTRALVLSGAGARGAYEAGVLKWLFKDIDTNGPPFDLICGTSAGSINTVFAARASSASIAQVGQLWLDMPQADILQLIPPAQHALNAGEAFQESSEHGWPAKFRYLTKANSELKAMGPKEQLAHIMGVVSSDGLDALVRKNPFTLADMKTSLIMTGTNMTHFTSDTFYHFVGPTSEQRTQLFLRRLVVESTNGAGATASPSNGRYKLTDDNLVKVVLGSAAVPGVFQPVDIPIAELGTTNLFVDGGVANNTPVSTSVHAGATDVTVIIASAPGEGMGKQPDTLPLLLSGSFNVTQRELLEGDLRLSLARNLLSRYRDYKGLSKSTVALLETIQMKDWQPIKIRVIRPPQPLKLTMMGFNDATDLQTAFDEGYKDAQNPVEYSI